MTCRSIYAGAMRLRIRTIETRYADRREAWVHFLKENRSDDVSSEAHGDVADDTAENAKLRIPRHEKESSLPGRLKGEFEP